MAEIIFIGLLKLFTSFLPESLAMMTILLIWVAFGVLVFYSIAKLVVFLIMTGLTTNDR